MYKSLNTFWIKFYDDSEPGRRYIRIRHGRGTIIMRNKRIPEYTGIVRYWFSLKSPPLRVRRVPVVCQFRLIVVGCRSVWYIFLGRNIANITAVAYDRRINVVNRFLPTHVLLQKGVGCETKITMIYNALVRAAFSNKTRNQNAVFQGNRRVSTTFFVVLRRTAKVT